MNKFKIFYCVLSLFTAATLWSCSDDDTVTTPLESPVAAETGKTVSTLAFNWDKVAGAVQYAYELYDPAGELVYGNVTTANAIQFAGLTPSTTYTLKVWAYGAIGGDKSTSPTFVLTATTPDVIQLQSPVPTSEASGPNIVVSWQAVDNAAYYTYSYYPSDDESKVITKQTDNTQVTLSGLSTGDYTFVLTAISNQEAFSNSESATITFTRERQELWRVTGTFHSGYYEAYNMSADWDVVMVHYDDGSYTLLNWMFGGEGYDLIFTVNDDSTISISNANGSWSDYTTVEYYPGGYCMYYNTNSGYCSFTGDSSRGSLSIAEYYGTDTFTWGSTANYVTFNVTTYGNDNSLLFSTFQQTAEKVSDTEYVFDDFLNSGRKIKVTNDSNNNLHLEKADDGDDIYYYPQYFDQWFQGPFYLSNDKSESSYVYGAYIYVDAYSDWSQNCTSWWTGNAGFYLNCKFYYDSSWTKSGYGYIYFNLAD